MVNYTNMKRANNVKNGLCMFENYVKIQETRKFPLHFIGIILFEYHYNIRQISFSYNKKEGCNTYTAFFLFVQENLLNQAIQ